MFKRWFLFVTFTIFLLILFHQASIRAQEIMKEEFKPLSYEQADKKADSVLALMTLDEKIAYVGGDKNFFIRAIPRLNLPEVYMSDATQGVHIRKTYREGDLSKYQLEKSTAFPCPLSLAATWNPDLSYKYAKSVGEECRAGGRLHGIHPGLSVADRRQGDERCDVRRA